MGNRHQRSQYRRVYNFMLGGKDNFAADRQVAELALQIAPDAPKTARANRLFLKRVVDYLATQAGIRQFLDIGGPACPATNDIKLSREGHQPEDDPGQRGQAGGLAGFAGLVPAARALGLAFVAAAGPGGTRLRAKVIPEARSAAMSSRRSGGKAAGVADAAADSVAGAGEGDAGGVDPGAVCGVADQGADRLVAAEHGVDLLPDHRRGLRAQHHRGTAADRGFQLIEAGFQLPAGGVGAGGLLRGQQAGIGDVGDQGEGLGDLAAVLGGHRVLDDTDGDAGNVTAGGALAAQPAGGGRVGDP